MSDATNLAGRLREPIAIEQVSLESDGLGGHTQSWSNYANCFAEVHSLSGSLREQVIAAQREARAAYRIILRRRTGIDTTMRIGWQGMTLHIHGVSHSRATTEIIAYSGGEV